MSNRHQSHSIQCTQKALGFTARTAAHVSTQSTLQHTSTRQHTQHASAGVVWCGEYRSTFCPIRINRVVQLREKVTGTHHTTPHIAHVSTQSTCQHTEHRSAHQHAPAHRHASAHRARVSTHRAHASTQSTCQHKYLHHGLDGAVLCHSNGQPEGLKGRLADPAGNHGTAAAAAAGGGERTGKTARHWLADLAQHLLQVNAPSAATTSSQSS